MIRRKPRKDPVTTALHDEVIARDYLFAGGCVAAFLDATHWCADRWGDIRKPDWLPALTLDHVQSGGGRMGKRAPSDRAHLVTLCYRAHLGGWATSHRPLLREYIARAEAGDCGHVEPVHGCASCRRHADPLSVGQS